MIGCPLLIPALLALLSAGEPGQAADAEPEAVTISGQVFNHVGAGVPGMQVEVYRADEQGAAVGTPLEFENGTFTGRFAGPVSNGEEKKIRVVEIVEDQDVWAAYGDSLSDVPMLELSQLPVAVAPEPELLKFAQEHNWRVLAV